MVVGAGVVKVVAVDTIVQDVDEIAKAESGAFNAFGNITLGSDEIPFVGFGIEGFQVVVGDEHAVATKRHHFAIVLKQVSIKVAAMVNRLIDSNG